MRNQAPLMTAALALTLVATAGCSKKNGPDSFVKASIEAVDGKPRALWSALPKSYQGDVQRLLGELATKMNADLYGDGFTLAGKLVKVLETKQAFILKRPELEGTISADDLKKGWDPTVRVLSRLLSSDLKTVDGLKTLDVEKFLAGPVAESINDLTLVASVAAKAAPMPDKDVGDMLAKLKAAKITIEKSDETTASVKIEVEGEKPESVEMVKVEDKWIPKELAEAWKPGIAQASAAVAQINIDTEMVTQMKVMKAMVEPTLDGLLASKTQEEFDGHIAKAMEGFGMGGKSELAATEGNPDEAAAELEARPKKKSKRSKSRRRRR